MTVYNLGSINVDNSYRLTRLPSPGETLPASGQGIGLGGKGANQSVAVARAGSVARHIGMVGPDNNWVIDRLAEYGVDTTDVALSTEPTGHAIIMVDDQGENAIVTYAGANYAQSAANIETALADATAGDTFMLQNEVSEKHVSVRIAQKQGLFIVYSAAPFRADVVADLIPSVNLLVLNEIEAEQLSAAMGLPIEEIPVANLLITKGAEGAVWHDQETGEQIEAPAFPVDAVDTTGAGDCFIGYVVAGLDQGLGRASALFLGAAAAALHVTRPGTAGAVPTRAEVDAFLAETETK